MNSREIASVVWLGGFLLWGATRSDVRSGYWQVVEAFVHPKVMAPVVGLAAWTVGLCTLAQTVGLWKTDAMSDTVVWFLSAGMALFFALDNVTEDGWIGRTIRRSVRIAVFVEVFVNLRVFSLPVELVLVPFVTFVGMLGVVAEQDDRYRAVQKLVNATMFVLGVVFIVHVTASLIDDVKADETVRKLLLPVWLSIGVMPLIYLVGLWSAYEQAFLRIGFQTDDPATRRRATRAFAGAVKWHAADAGGFAGHWIYDLAHAVSTEAAHDVMRRFRASWRAERRDDLLNNARADLELWLNETDPVQAKIHEDALRKSWERLDGAQRDVLAAEVARLPRRSRKRFEALQPAQAA